MRPHRRYSEEEKRVLLTTVARAQEQSDQPLNWILAELGLTRSVHYDWLDREKGETSLTVSLCHGLPLPPCLRRLKQQWLTPRLVPETDIAILRG